MLIVVSAPSGAGKSTICKELIKRHPEVELAVSYTTRPPRPGEKNGHDYFFISEKEFKRKIAKDEFLEWAIVHGYYYGTPKKFVEGNLNKKKDVLLEIDVQGAMKIRSLYPKAILIFVLPVSKTKPISAKLAALRKRLLENRREDPDEVKKRLAQAKKELKLIKKYDYFVVNDCFKKAVKRLEKILLAERLKISGLAKTTPKRNRELKSLENRRD